MLSNYKRMTSLPFLLILGPLFMPRSLISFSCLSFSGSSEQNTSEAKKHSKRSTMKTISKMSQLNTQSFRKTTASYTEDVKRKNKRAIFLRITITKKENKDEKIIRHIHCYPHPSYTVFSLF